MVDFKKQIAAPVGLTSHANKPALYSKTQILAFWHKTPAPFSAQPGRI